MKLILLCLCMILLGNMAWGQWTEPVLLPPPINVNPPGSYYYSAISADGQILCITIYPGQFGDDDVYISERIGDSSWTVPVNAGPNINNVQRNLSPSITSDRQRLYYVSYTGSYDIFVSYRTGPAWDDWTEGVALPTPVNRGREFTAQISFDDSTLSFTSTGQPGPLHGEDAMYSSRLQPDNSWSEPLAIAPHLNALNGAYHPCLTNNGNTLVYGMFYPPHFDIWYSFRNDSGFGAGFRCDSTINTRFWDSSPSCTENGSLLYFDSRRNESGHNEQARMYVARRIGTSISARFSTTVPESYSLFSYPNPFNPTTTISFSLTTSEFVKLSVFDITGREVKVLVNEMKSAGEYKMEFDGKNLASGIYLARIEMRPPFDSPPINRLGENNAAAKTIKMILLK